MRAGEIRYALGLALGRLGEGEPSAIAVVRTRPADLMEVLHLERSEPGTSTRVYAGRVAAICSQAPLHRQETKFRDVPGQWGVRERYTAHTWPDVRIDATGASESEVAAIRAALPGGTVLELVLTNGDAEGRGRMARRDLAGLLRDYLEGGRLTWPRSLAHGRLLEAELRRFRAKVPAGRTDADRAFRENANDDLVLAVGMGVVAAREGGAVFGEACAELFRDYRGI